MEYNFRKRSVAVLTHYDTGSSFEVVCYGMNHIDLCEEDVGGGELKQRLRKRGIDTDDWHANPQSVYPLNNVWQEPKPTPGPVIVASPNPWGNPPSRPAIRNRNRPTQRAVQDEHY